MSLINHLSSKLNHTFWKIIPYVSLVASTALFLWLAAKTFTNIYWGNWFLGISINLVSVLLIYFFYELIKAKSEKELKKELSEYARSYIDVNILNILHTISKLVYGPTQGRSLGGTLTLPELERKAIQQLLQDGKFWGFQLFKSWSYTYDYFSEIIGNNFVMNRLGDDQILIVLKIKNSLRQLENFFSNKDNFVMTEEAVSGYRVVNGRELNPQNQQFPNRYLLMRELKGDRYVVEDFGDFRASDIENLLRTFTIKREAVDLATSRLLDLLSLVKRWLESTGNELKLN